MLNVCAVGDDLARPFVYGACDRYEMPFDPESGDAMLWWAGFDRGGIRSILGWAEEPSVINTIVIVGPFGDGSGFEETWMNELLLSMQIVSAQFVVIPASPSLFIRRQSAQLERYGTCRTPHFARAV